jgi:hypothetical protein
VPSSPPLIPSLLLFKVTDTTTFTSDKRRQQEDAWLYETCTKCLQHLIDVTVLVGVLPFAPYSSFMAFLSLTSSMSALDSSPSLPSLSPTSSSPSPPYLISQTPISLISLPPVLRGDSLPAPQPHRAAQELYGPQPPEPCGGRSRSVRAALQQVRCASGNLRVSRSLHLWRPI